MKKWNQPEVEVLGVDETKFGSQTETTQDGVYVDPTTKNKYRAWSASGKKDDSQNKQ